MSKVICYTNEKGFATLVHIAPEMFDADSPTRKELEAMGYIFENDEQIIAWVALKDIPPNTEYLVVDSEKLPTDKQYRNAWVIKDDKSGIDVSLDKAKPLQLDRIRNMRINVFDAADIEFNKAVEKVLNKLMGNNPDDADMIALKAVMQKRQDLRDAPAIDLSDVQTIDELKTKVPDVLKP